MKKKKVTISEALNHFRSRSNKPYAYGLQFDCSHATVYAAANKGNVTSTVLLKLLDYEKCKLIIEDENGKQTQIIS